MERKESNRTVLITGGTGFVCMNIAELLLNRGINVVLFARRPLRDEVVKEMSEKLGTISYYYGDVLKEADLNEAISRYEVTDVIHGAAVTPSREMEMERPKEIMNINCMGLINSLDAARLAGVKRFIYLGSVSGYGETCFTSDVLVEGESLGNPHSLYELSKFAGERIVQRYRDLYQMDAIVARVGDVFGPWERKTGVRSYMSFPYQLTSAAMKKEAVILPKPNCIDWVYGRDIAESVLALLLANTLHYDVYPLCSGYLWSLMDWCERLEKRYPGFVWKLAENGDVPTMRVNQIEDNAPMQLDRLIEDTGVRPKYNIDLAFCDYMAWLDNHPDYIG